MAKSSYQCVLINKSCTMCLLPCLWCNSYFSTYSQVYCFTMYFPTAVCVCVFLCLCMMCIDNVPNCKNEWYQSQNTTHIRKYSSESNYTRLPNAVTVYSHCCYNFCWSRFCWCRNRSQRKPTTSTYRITFITLNLTSLNLPFIPFPFVLSVSNALFVFLSLCTSLWFVIPLLVLVIKL